MVINKKKSQYTVIAYTDIDSSTRFDILDGSLLDNHTVIWGTLGTDGLITAIYNALHQAWTSVSIPANTTDQLINLGSSSAYRYVEIEYIAERGSKVRGGKIKVLNTGTICQANDSYIDSEDDSTWLSCGLSVATSAQIQIAMTTDNADVTATSFKYRINALIPVV